MIQGLISPPPGTLIDGSRGLANKLLVAGRATTGGWVDAVQKTPGYTATGGSFGLGQFGPKRSHTATSDKFSGVGIGNNLPAGKDSTLLIIYAKRDTTNRNSGVLGFQASSPGSGNYGFHGPFSDGKIYFDFAGNTDGVTRLTVTGQTWVAGVPSVWIFTTGPRGMECWRDGVKVGSNSATPSRTLIGNLWCLGTHTNVASDLDDYYAVDCWARQLEKSEIALLSGDPFAMYRRPQLAKPLLFSAAIPPASGRRRQLINC